MDATFACDLFHRCLSDGNNQDWQEFLKRYDRRLRRTVRRAARRDGGAPGEPDPEELVQELLCRLLTVPCGRFRGRTDGELWSYLYRVACNLVADQGRAARSSKRCRMAGPRDPVQADPGWIDGLVSLDHSPEEQCLKREAWRLFLRLSWRVVHGDRGLKLWVMRMVLVEGWTSREIAGRLKGRLGPEQIDNLFHRLKRHLAQNGVEISRRTGVHLVRRPNAVRMP